MKSLSRRSRSFVIGGIATLLVIIILAGAFSYKNNINSHAQSQDELTTLEVNLQVFREPIYRDICNFRDFRPQKGEGLPQDYANASDPQGCYYFFVTNLKNSHQGLANYLNTHLTRVNGIDEVHAWEVNELQLVESEDASFKSQTTDSPFYVIGTPQVVVSQDDNVNSNNRLSLQQQNTLDTAFTHIFLNLDPVV